MDLLEQQYDQMANRYDHLDSQSHRTPAEEQEIKLATDMQQTEQQYQQLDDKLSGIKDDYKRLQEHAAEYIKDPLKAAKDRAADLKVQQRMLLKIQDQVQRQPCLDYKQAVSHTIRISGIMG